MVLATPLHGIALEMLALFEDLDDLHVQNSDDCKDDQNLKHVYASCWKDAIACLLYLGGTLQWPFQGGVSFCAPRRNRAKFNGLSE